MSTSPQDAGAPVSQAILDEIGVKKQRLAELLEKSNLSGVLLSRHENVAWATAGQVDMRVAVPAATGSAAVFVRKDGTGYYLTTANEAPRMKDEEFAGLPFEPVVLPWADADYIKTAQGLAGADKIGADMHEAGCPVVDLAVLRSQLEAGEIERYRQLGAMTARVVEDVVLHLEPGVTEHEISAMTASRLIQKAILPSVLLMATDDRILKYKHALPRAGHLERFGMVNLCARK